MAHCSPELAVALESEVVQMQNFLEKQGHGSSVSVSTQVTVSLAVMLEWVVFSLHPPPSTIAVQYIIMVMCTEPLTALCTCQSIGPLWCS